MRLFGGFDTGVFHAYNDANPLTDGWADRVVLHQRAPLAGARHQVWQRVCRCCDDCSPKMRMSCGSHLFPVHWLRDYLVWITIVLAMRSYTVCRFGSLNNQTSDSTNTTK
jgi:hypothetical protein